jgi:alpha-1,3-rhamnosyl/mannosyltransferase
MIALEVSSAAGRPPHGGIGGAIRHIVSELLRLDPDTLYDLCYRLSRWRKGHLFRPSAPNARLRIIQDPLNSVLLSGDRILHSMGIYLPKTPRIPKLVTVHDLNAVRNVQWVRPEWHERRSRRIREVVGRADHVVTYSAFTADEVREEYRLPDDRVHPVLLGVDAQVFCPPTSETLERVRSEHGDYVISIGLITARKNFEALVRAVEPIEGLGLILVGRAADADSAVQRTIRETRMEKRVTRMERVSHQELVALIGAAHACAVPSLYEGFGLTVLEAMGCGTPVVCSQAASLPEAAGDAALLVDASDPEALRSGIRSIVEDSELATRLRELGLARAREMSWSASARNLRALYRQVAGI